MGEYGLYVVAMYKNKINGEILGYDVADTYAGRIVSVNPSELIVKFRAFCKSYELMNNAKFNATNIEVDYRQVKFKSMNPGKRKLYYEKLENGDIVKVIYAIITGYNIVDGTINCITENRAGELVICNNCDIYGLCGKLEVSIEGFRFFNGYVDRLNGANRVVVYSESGRATALAMNRRDPIDIRRSFGSEFELLGIHQDGGGIQIDKVIGSATAPKILEVPEGVTSVARFEFKRSTEVILPSSLDKISNASFASVIAADGSPLSRKQSLAETRCNVNSIRLSRTCTWIEKNAFAYSNLTDINLTSNIFAIGSGAFRGCKRLDIDLKLDGTVISASAFKGSGIRSVDISGLHEIRPMTFNDCERLESVKLSGTETICLRAFSKCKRLLTVKLPDTLKRIDAFAFAGTAMREIRIPKGCLAVADSAFDSCNNLTKVYIGKGTKIVRGSSKVEHLLTSNMLKVRNNLQIIRY